MGRESFFLTWHLSLIGSSAVFTFFAKIYRCELLLGGGFLYPEICFQGVVNYYIRYFHRVKYLRRGIRRLHRNSSYFEYD